MRDGVSRILRGLKGGWSRRLLLLGRWKVGERGE